MLLAGVTTCWLLGCHTVPLGRHAVDRMELLGNAAIATRDIEERIATAPSPRFVGIWQGVVFEYNFYDKFVLQRDIARIERFYRARGYYDAQVRAGRVVHTTDGHVRIEILVDEGEPVVLEPVRFTGLEGVPFKLQAKASQAVKLTAGQRFDEDQYEQGKGALLSVLTNQGYAWAKVTGTVQVNLVTHQVSVALHTVPGPRFKIRNVKISGLEDKIPEGPVRRALNLQPGDDFSAAELASARDALLDLGVFSDVEITWGPGENQAGGAPPVNEKGEPAIDVQVQVTPSLLRTLRLGGGGEMDVIRTDIHGNVGWEDRNFLGGLRRFSIVVKPGVVLFPTVLPTLRAPNRLLPEERARAELRQPGFIESRTNWLLRGEYNIYPVLLRPINEEVILGYREARASTGFDRSFLGYFYAAILAHMQTNHPFTYKGSLDATLGAVNLRYLELETVLNLRDNAVRPHKGLWLGNNLQFADLGGDLIDIKEQPDLRLYVPISRTVTFAVRASVGFLFPHNYGKSLTAGATADPEAFTRDVQLLYFRAFFSGGPNSNRGYPFRAIGPHGPAPFFSPNISAGQVLTEECNIFSPQYNEAICAVPLGGLSLWESSAELRFPILGDLSGALFVDASDVSRRRTTLRFDYPHLSTGTGLRYATPVGPVRFDVGYRIPGMQRLGGPIDTKVEGDPGTILGAPIAISIGVGESF